MNNTHRHLRKRNRLSTAPVETIFSQWLNRAMADERARAFIRDGLARSTPPLAEIQY